MHSPQIWPCIKKEVGKGGNCIPWWVVCTTSYYMHIFHLETIIPVIKLYLILSIYFTYQVEIWRHWHEKICVSNGCHMMLLILLSDYWMQRGGLVYSVYVYSITFVGDCFVLLETGWHEDVLNLKEKKWWCDDCWFILHIFNRKPLFQLTCDFTKHCPIPY